MNIYIEHPAATNPTILKNFESPFWFIGSTFLTHESDLSRTFGSRTFALFISSRALLRRLLLYIAERSGIWFVETIAVASYHRIV
jgi:hypothetical protein